MAYLEVDDDHDDYDDKSRPKDLIRSNSLNRRLAHMRVLHCNQQRFCIQLHTACRGRCNLSSKSLNDLHDI